MKHFRISYDLFRGEGCRLVWAQYLMAYSCGSPGGFPCQTWAFTSNFLPRCGRLTSASSKAATGPQLQPLWSMRAMPERRPVGWAPADLLENKAGSLLCWDLLRRWARLRDSAPQLNHGAAGRGDMLKVESQVEGGVCGLLIIQCEQLSAPHYHFGLLVWVHSKTSSVWDV